MHLRENVNFVKREQKMTDLLGHSNNFATLSLSLSLSGTNSQSTYFYTRAYVRECMAFFAEMQGKLCCFYPLCLSAPSATGSLAAEMRRRVQR